jgi:hypothetical protein
MPGNSVLDLRRRDFLDEQRSVTKLTHLLPIPLYRHRSTTRRGIMALQRHIYECIFGMILAMALIIAATTWAFSPNPAAPIPPSEVIYQPQHWNAY